MIKKLKSQSMLEYLLILGAIILGIMAATGRIQTAVTNHLNNAAQVIEDAEIQTN